MTTETSDVIINAVHHPTAERLWTWLSSCGLKGTAYYSTAYQAVRVGRDIHKVVEHKCKE